MTEQTEFVLSQERQSRFWSLIRSSPISLLGTLILMCLIYPSFDNYLFTLFYMGIFGLNVSLKYVFKKIYDYLGIDYIPYIGQGSRPPGAHSCKSFVSVPLLPATSFGMPSGHSQLAWFFAIYGCFILCSNPVSYFSNNTMNQTLKIISCIGLITIAAIISYSRVFIEECHTPGQVCIGGLIGIGSALVAYIIKCAIMFIL